MIHIAPLLIAGVTLIGAMRTTYYDAEANKEKWRNTRRMLLIALVYLPIGILSEEFVESNNLPSLFILIIDYGIFIPLMMWYYKRR